VIVFGKCSEERQVWAHGLREKVKVRNLKAGIRKVNLFAL
jgi:hypothetical protein